MRLKCWETFGLVFTLIAGTLLHFVYQWTGQNMIAAAFSPVNESVWEHLKLVFFPMLFISAAEYFAFGRGQSCFVPVKALSMLLGTGSVVVLFYVYSGIAGGNFLVLDILTFVLAAFAAFLFSFCQLSRPFPASRREEGLGWVTIALLLVCFVLFTFYPPQIGLFRDPVSGGYGIIK